MPSEAHQVLLLCKLFPKKKKGKQKEKSNNLADVV